MPANPNHTSAARSQAKAAPPAEDDDKKGPKKDLTNLSRREREAVQAEQARERYQKLHAEGKTDEARSDLARLKLIKEKREIESARKKAEKEEKEAADQKRLDEMDAREKKKREDALGPKKVNKKAGKA